MVQRHKNHQINQKVHLKVYSLIMLVHSTNLLTWIRNDHRILALVFSISIMVEHSQCPLNLSLSIMAYDRRQRINSKDRLLPDLYKIREMGCSWLRTDLEHLLQIVNKADTLANLLNNTELHLNIQLSKDNKEKIVLSTITTCKHLPLNKMLTQ